LIYYHMLYKINL